jgi:quinol monooxygenase YgiN
MFARTVSMQVKPNSLKQFTETLENEIIPTLRKQKGFKDEMLFVIPGGPEVLAISMWESKENAETYNSTTYPGVLKSLANLIEASPKVKAYDVAHSTFHKIVAREAVAVHA